MGIIDHRLELAVSKLIQRGHGTFMSQQTLRRHNDQWLAQRSYRLTAQHVEHLRRRAWHTDLYVLLSRQLEVTLETSR